MSVYKSINNIFELGILKLRITQSVFSIPLVLVISRLTQLAALSQKVATQLLIIMKSLDPLRAKKIFIRKKLGHTAVSATKASSVTL